MRKFSKDSKGFTLIELLVVITIISILSVGVWVALNPTRRFYESRNSRRVTDINNILTAVHECIVDNGGTETACIGTLVDDEVYEIVNTGIAAECDDVCTGVTSDTHCAAIDGLLGAYLKSLPTDPGGVTTDHTEYTISIDVNNMITIGACSAENSVIIEAAR